MISFMTLENASHERNRLKNANLFGRLHKGTTVNKTLQTFKVLTECAANCLTNKKAITQKEEFTLHLYCIDVRLRQYAEYALIKRMKINPKEVVQKAPPMGDIYGTLFIKLKSHRSVQI